MGGDLGIEPLNLRRNKWKVILLLKLLKKKEKAVEEVCFRYYK